MHPTHDDARSLPPTAQETPTWLLVLTAAAVFSLIVALLMFLISFLDRLI